MGLWGGFECAGEITLDFEIWLANQQSWKSGELWRMYFDFVILACSFRRNVESYWNNAIGIQPSGVL